MKRLLLLVSVLALTLTSLAQAANVQLQWNPNTETNLLDYQLWRGFAPNGSTNPVPYTQITNVVGRLNTNAWDQVALTNGWTVFYRLTARNTALLQSDPSAAVSLSVPAAPVLQLKSVLQSNTNLTVNNWQDRNFLMTNNVEIVQESESFRVKIVPSLLAVR